MRRIVQWGFEKNTKRKERRAILESLGDEMNAKFETKIIRGRMLDKAKVERWRKREGIPCGGSRDGLAPEPGIRALSWS